VEHGVFGRGFRVLGADLAFHQTQPQPDTGVLSDESLEHQDGHQEQRRDNQVHKAIHSPNDVSNQSALSDEYAESLADRQEAQHDQEKAIGTAPDVNQAQTKVDGHKTNAESHCSEGICLQNMVQIHSFLVSTVSRQRRSDRLAVLSGHSSLPDSNLALHIQGAAGYFPQHPECR
jgi:hypothetical protein